MDARIETIEDLQLRALRRVHLFNGAELPAQTLPGRNRHIITSSRYGISIALGPQGRLYSMSTADIHKLGIAPSGNEKPATSGDIRIRTIQYYNNKALPLGIAMNSDGTALSVAVQTTNGPFVDIFYAIAFDPGSDKQPFPMSSIRLSSNQMAQLCDLEWNPAEPDLFAAITSDNMISTVRCAALQLGGSPGNSGATFASCPLAGALCLSWSPKGKQLVVGDADGRVHQLKPELTGSAVRQIEAPQNVPTCEGQPLACTALCWLTTTEWLVAYKPKQRSQEAPSISLMVVKKQQQPKWTHFGDALPAARIGRLTFCPLLDWHMVFLFSPDSTQVALFGQRGEHWCKFEFETYDIEMPLGGEAGRSNTFPIGATIDVSSMTPLQLDQGGEQLQFPPCPILHFLNSDGQLLPYAIVSLMGNNEQRPALNKMPESIQPTNAHFGQAPLGWTPSPQLPASNPLQMQQLAIQQQQSNQSQNPVAFQTTPTPQAASFQFQNLSQNAPAEQRPRTSAQFQITQQPTMTATAEEQAKAAEKQAERRKRDEEAADRRKIEETEKQLKETREREIEGRKMRVDELEKELEQTILEYTNQRNIQTLKMEKQLGQLRYEIERRASSTDQNQTHINQLATIRSNLLDSLRQKSLQLDGICKNIQRNGETLNQLKLGYIEAKKKQLMGHEGKEESSSRATAPSFDIQKRLELVEKHYDKTLNDFERAKRTLNNLDEQFQLYGGYDGKRIDENDETIDAVEQRKLIQTNDNIAKISTKLTIRLHQIQRQMEIQRATMDGKEKPKLKMPKDEKQQKDGRKGKGKDIIADFCLMELSQMHIGGEIQSDTNENISASSLPTETLPQFQQNLYNYLTSPSAVGPSNIRRIQPLRPTVPIGPRQTENSFAASSCDQLLAQKMHELFTTPSKPQLVSIGVQSPDFTEGGIEKDGKRPQLPLPTTPKTTATKPYSLVPPKPMSIQSSTVQSSLPFGNIAFNRPIATASTPIKSTGAPTPPSFSPITTSASSISTQQPTTAFMFKPHQPLVTSAENALPNNADLPSIGLFNSRITPSIETTTIAAAITAPTVTTTPNLVFTTQTTTASLTTTATATSARAPLLEQQKPTEEKSKTTLNESQKMPTTIAPISTTTIGKTVENAQITAAADEGMEDEMVTATSAATATPAAQPAVNFDFMKGIGLGAAGSPSTPINTNRNPFGSITPALGQNVAAGTGLFGNATASPQGSAVGSGPFGTPSFQTPASSFSTPNRSSGTGAFGSFSTSAAASPPSGSSAFGASPFGGAGAFGAKPTFGSASPFASGTATQSAFGANQFGGDVGTQQQSISSPAAGIGGGSTFAGGFGGGAAAGTGFSAFASKSSAFGQLANQAQQAPGGGSLFGGGVAPTGGTGFTSFGGGVSATPSAFGQQQKSSAFTMFRK